MDARVKVGEESKVLYFCDLWAVPSEPLFLRFCPQDDGELSFAGFGWVVEGSAFAVGFGGTEEESLLGIFGEPDETGLALGIGSDLKVELVQVHESVSDVDANVGGVDWLAVFVGNGEIGGARAEAGIDFGDGFRVHFRVCRMGGLGERTCKCENQQSEGNGESEGVSEGGKHTLLEYAKEWSRGQMGSNSHHQQEPIGIKGSGYQRSLPRCGWESIIF